MSKALLWLTLASILTTSPSHAETAGRVRIGADHFFTRQLDPVASDEGFLGLELEGKYKLSDWLRFRLEPKARFSTADKIVDDQIDGDFRDSGFEGKFGNVRFQLGTFIRAWEGTDGLNPMDIASMKNYRDPLAGENLSSLGIAFSGGQGFMTWDVLWVPRQTQSRLPGEKSPWLPRRATLPLEKESTRLLVPENPTYEILGREVHNDALDHNRGARLQFHGKSWDLSVAGFDGASQTPYLFPIITGTLIESTPSRTTIQMGNPIRIMPIDYRRQTMAGAFVYTHDTWIFRIAGRHDQPVGNGPIVQTSVGGVDLPTWSSQFVGGLEKTVTVRDQNVIFSLQGAYGQSPESGSIISASDLFRRAVLGGVRWPWNDDLVFSFAGFYETQKGGGYARLGAQKKLSDPTTLELYADGTEGPDDSLLGVWRDQKRAGLALLYQF